MPTFKKNKPDLKYLRDTVKSIKPYLRFGQVIVLESTSYPGTTEEEIIKKLDKIYHRKNFYVGFPLRGSTLELMKTKLN